MAQAILSVDQVLSVLRSEMSTLKLKLALLQFLVSVYITMSEDDDTHTKIHNHILKDNRIWNFIADSRELLLTRAIDYGKNNVCDPALDEYIYKGVMNFILSYFKVCCDSYRIADHENTSIAEGLLGSLIILALSIKGSGKDETQIRKRALLCIEAMRSAGFLSTDAESDISKLKEMRDVDNFDGDIDSPTSSSPITPPPDIDATEYLISENIVGLNSSLQEIVRHLAADKSIKTLQAIEFDELGKY